MIFRSPYPDVAIPDVSLTPFVLRHAARLADKAGADRRPQRPDADLRRNWPPASGARRPAWRSTGFRKGDVFAICAPNSPEYAVAFHAVASLGGIVTTVNPALHRRRTGSPAQRRGRDAPADRRPTRWIGRARRRRAVRCRRSSSSSVRPPGQRRLPRCSQPTATTARVAIDPEQDVVAAPLLERHDRSAQRASCSLTATSSPVSAKSAAPRSRRRRRGRARGSSLLPYQRACSLMTIGLCAGRDAGHHAALRADVVPAAASRTTA